MIAAYPPPDIAAIHEHVNLLHRLAAPLAGQGKLVVASFGQDPKKGKSLVPKICHFPIGQIDAMVDAIARLTQERHRNVYSSVAVMRLDLPDGEKGGEADIVGMLGAVEDFDDPDAAQWKERLPVDACYALETSVDRFQAFLLTDDPLVDLTTAKRLAIKLKTFTNCDHGSADLSHVWRIPGTLNWPNAKKLKEGRPADPQLVRVIEPCRKVWDLTSLAEYLLRHIPDSPEPPEPPIPNGADHKLAEIIASLPARTIARLRAAATGQDRSDVLFGVIAQLCDLKFDDATIEKILRQFPGGIVSKYRDRSDLNKEISRVRIKTTKPIADEVDDDPITELNKTFAVIRVVNRVAILNEHLDAEGRPTFSLLNLDSFKLWLAHRSAEIPSLDKEGKPVTVTVPLAPYWLKHARRRQYDGITFAPQGAPRGYFNLWTGFAVKPSEQGSCELFKEHLFDNVCDGNSALYNWVFAWFADIFQNPTSKCETALVLRGDEGVGKTIVGETFGYLLGLHYCQVADPRYVIGRFNAHVVKCLLFHCDEAFWAGDKVAEGKVKDLISGKRHPVELKGYEVFWVPNYVRVFINGNADWLVPAGKGARRTAVLDVTDTHKEDIPYFAAIEGQLKAGGYERLLHEILTFDPTGIDIRHVPKTKALLDQKIASLKPEDGWLLDILQKGQLPHATADAKPGVCPAQLLHDDYLEHTTKHGVRRRSIETALSIFLFRMFPGIFKYRGRYTIKDATSFASADRGQGAIYKFPPLSECREIFAATLNQSIDWQLPTEWEAGYLT
jgi:hypothetical protein